MSKERILDLLGERALLLPALLGAAVIANEQAKYVLALLQMAVANADTPNLEPATLRAEREACGIADMRFDQIIARSEALGPGVYYVPEAAHLVDLLAKALDTMLAPLGIAEDKMPEHNDLAQRKQRLFQAIPLLKDDVICGDTVASLTSGRPLSGDGIHLLVMDLHKAINELQASTAEEEVDGARVRGLLDLDRRHVCAFMRGVNSTAALKFDHPGLATTAMRSGEVLLIQNDIGETDAHVLVVQVKAQTVRSTYTDVHPQRLRFFRDTLAASGMVWEETRSRQTAGLADGDLFYLVTGEFSASDESTLDAFLERVGSRIVFLIDWNRARKRLGLLVPNALAVELLNWAAEHNFGHRAFLQLGGERLIYHALEQAVRTPLRYGEKLHEMIGPEAARGYLQFVLETTATGLRDGRSQTLIGDRIRAELFNHFRSAEERLFGDAARHAEMVVQLAQGLCGALHEDVTTGSNAFATNADQAKALESRADDIVRAIRSTSQRIAGTDIFRHIVEIADDAADALEEAAFLAALSIEGQTRTPLPAPLVELAQLVLDGAEAFQRTVEAAPLVHRGGNREAAQTFLEAADSVATAEHRTDLKERDVMVALMTTPSDARYLHLVGEISRHLEEAADALMRASLTLRDHVLGAVFE